MSSNNKEDIIVFIYLKVLNLDIPPLSLQHRSVNHFLSFQLENQIYLISS